MVRDLRAILDGWEYEPGRISVRKIIGRDGREKIQTRVDLGVMQIEAEGRPDGGRPRDADSLLQHFEQALSEHIRAAGSDEHFTLTPEQCRDLRHEAYLYHQRYVSLFVLEEYDNVVRDSEHTLRIIDLCARYAADERDRRALSIYRNYAAMMNARGRGLAALSRGQHDQALAITDAGIRMLHTLAETSVDEDGDAGVDNSGEVDLLENLREQIVEQMPPDALARLRRELDAALAAEDYERAARLRDRIQGDGSPRDSEPNSPQPDSPDMYSAPDSPDQKPPAD